MQEELNSLTFSGLIVLDDFIFNVVVIVEIKPLAGFIICMIFRNETSGGHGCFHRVDIFDHDCNMIEAAVKLVTVLF